jgi:autotransporter-associated beta strand protein
LRGGFLQVTQLGNAGGNSALGNTTNDANNLLFDGGTLQYNGAVATTTDRNITISTAGGGIDNSSANSAATLTLVGTTPQYLVSGARTFNFGGTNTGNNVFNFVLADSGGATAVTKSGTGLWTMNGANTYTGLTTISSGTLSVTQPTGFGDVSTGTTVLAGATAQAEGNITLAMEPMLLTGSGVNGGGALVGKGTVTLPNRVHVSGNTAIGATAGSNVTISGTIFRESAFDLIFAGAGNVLVQSTISDADYTLSPFTALAFNGVNQAINDPAIITNDFNGTTAPTRSATLTTPLTMPNLAAFNAIFLPSIPLGDTFTTVFYATLTVATPAT